MVMRYHWGSGVGHIYSHDSTGVTPAMRHESVAVHDGLNNRHPITDTDATPIGSGGELDEDETEDTTGQGAHHDSPDHPDVNNTLPRDRDSSLEEHDTLGNPDPKTDGGAYPEQHTNSEDLGIQNTGVTNGDDLDEQRDEQEGGESEVQNVDPANGNDQDEERDEDEDGEEDEDGNTLEGSDCDVGQEERDDRDEMFGEVEDGAFSYD